MKPTIGRIVHFTPYENEIFAAIVVDVEEGLPSLRVFNTCGGSYHASNVPQAPENVLAGDYRAIGTWQWPAREEG